MMNTVLRLISCWTEKLYSVHSGDLVSWTIAFNAGASNTTPLGNAAWIWLKLCVMLKALAEAVYVAGAPLGSNGSTPVLGGLLRTRIATVEGGLANKLSTIPAAGLS